MLVDGSVRPARELAVATALLRLRGRVGGNPLRSTLGGRSRDAPRRPGAHLDHTGTSGSAWPPQHSNSSARQRRPHHHLRPPCLQGGHRGQASPSTGPYGTARVPETAHGHHRRPSPLEDEHPRPAHRCRQHYPSTRPYGAAHVPDSNRRHPSPRTRPCGTARACERGRHQHRRRGTREEAHPPRACRHRQQHPSTPPYGKANVLEGSRCQRRPQPNLRASLCPSQTPRTAPTAHVCN